MSDYGDKSTIKPALWYFITPHFYFWRFTEKGAVAEWTNGPTICYREELESALETFVPTGLPPLTTVLLLLAACQDDWNDSGNLGTLHGFARAAPAAAGETADDVAGYLEQTGSFLNIVAALPQSLRTGLGKWHLFRQLVQYVQIKVLADDSSGVMSEWTSGRLDTQLDVGLSTNVRVQLADDLASFSQLSQRFPTTEALALFLRTGLDKLPAPLPLPAPVVPEPAPDAPAGTDLLSQLAQDARTAGLARLAQHLVAALRIPLHARGASDQPVGGVADVTNRGSFDRLLLSELAHDDLSLMARLVNNEALYLRREAPPQPEVKPRVVLLDTTLRMWGVPRVFALAAALAWARNSQQGRPAVPVVAFVLGGQQAEPLDLDTLAGVVAALGRLDPAPHAGPALLEVARTPPAVGAGDCLLITEAELLHQPDFARALAQASPALRFLLTVARSGELQLYAYQNGHRTLLSTTQYDLAELLFTARPRRPLLPPEVSAEPAFWQHSSAPLYLPVLGLRMSVENTFQDPRIGVLAINRTRRVLFWPDKDFGARQLLPLIEAGNYRFASDGQREIYVLVSGPELLVVYAFRADEEPRRVDLSSELKSGEDPIGITFKEQCYCVQLRGDLLVFDCERWHKSDSLKFAASAAVVPTSIKPNFNYIKRYVNNGYNVLQRVNNLAVNAQDEFVIDGYELRLVDHPTTPSPDLQLVPSLTTLKTTPQRRAENSGEVASATNELITLRHFRWPDGSTAIVDPRGLLHLRSADATVPEMSVLLILGKLTAAWAADGAVCGPAYFTGPNPAQLMAAPAFNRRYLQSFIAHLG